MPVTVYEKNNVKSNMEAVFYGKLTFNKLDEPRLDKPNEFVRNPKPAYVLALTEIKVLSGDNELVSALKDTMYGEHKEKLSLYDKSPFPPMIYDPEKQGKQSNHLLKKGTALKNGQFIKVHVHTFESYGNIGCGFDAIMVGTRLGELELQDTTGHVSANVFDI